MLYEQYLNNIMLCKFKFHISLVSLPTQKNASQNKLLMLDIVYLKFRNASTRQTIELL